MPVVIEIGVALEPITADLRASVHVCPDKLANLIRSGVRQDSNTCAASDVSLLVDTFIRLLGVNWSLLDGTDDHGFVGILGTATVAFLFPPAIERLVNLDQVVQLEIRGIIGQSMAQLVAHQPGRIIPDGKLSADHHGRHAPFVMADEVRRHEPLTQIGAGLVENGATRDRVLMAALGALKDAGPRRQMIRFGTLALVASKAIRPTQLGKCLNTGVFITVLVTESKKARCLCVHGPKTITELDYVHQLQREL